MPAPDPFAPLTFAHSGLTMPNRLMLAPLTNQQSHADGTLSDDEFHWLTLRAKGGFGLTMTCAAHVQRIGQGFPGQLGVWSDDHIPGLTRLASAIKAEGSLAMVQLHHAGMRSPAAVIGEAPVCPSENAEFGARALSEGEVQQLIEDFLAAAVRAKRAGFEGVELHGAHGYILAQFLSPSVNQRTDRYGGSFENRARIVFELIDGVRARCGADFLLGLRLSPERFGLLLGEIRELAAEVMRQGKIDFLDMSLWDFRKEPHKEAWKGRSLMSVFTELDRHEVRLGVAGQVRTGGDVADCLTQGADYALIGRAAMLHHDFPKRLAADPRFEPVPLPVSRDHLQAEGLGPAFLDYMENWPGGGFVAKPTAEAEAA